MFENPLRTKSMSHRPHQLTLGTMHSYTPDGATVSRGCCRSSGRMRILSRGCPSL